MTKSIKKSGVYKIKHLRSGRVYIGSSVNIPNRIRQHIKNLNSGTHCNSFLQRCWTKSNGVGFIIGVLEFIDDKDSLTFREQFYLDKYHVGNKEICFNIKTIAYSSLGFKFSDESKLKMSIAKKGKKWTDAQIKSLTNKPKRFRPHLTGKNSSRSKTIYQYDLSGKYIDKWDSINQCSVNLKIHKSNIIVCLKGKIKQIKGYVFKYEYNQ